MKTRRSARSTQPTLVNDRGGAVYVEFLLAFIPLFLLFLGMVQMGLLYACDLVVRHASVSAARAAMVVLDDVPTRYDGELRRAFGEDGLPQDTLPRRFVDDVLGERADRTRPPSIDSQRFAAIHAAASIPLLPFAPAAHLIWRAPNDESVFRAIGNIPEARSAFGVLYNEAGLSVTFPTSPGESDYRVEWGAPDDSGVVDPDEGRAVTARVTYLFHCAVPLANRLLCEDLLTLDYGRDRGRVGELSAALARGDLSYAAFQEELAALRNSSDRLTRWSSRTQELQDSDLLAAMAGLSPLFGGPSPRFMPIQREATMPLQAANYRYHDADDGEGWDQETGAWDGDDGLDEPWIDPGGE